VLGQQQVFEFVPDVHGGPQIASRR
jgi:hypothetical protein